MNNPPFTTLTLGTCYYPEHWPGEMWAEDLRRMRENGIHVIRIAEFAWNKFEPAEGEFTFDFFDGFMRLAEAAGMQVIFCTPTATPPAWASHKYPEILNARRDGVQYSHGMRRHYSYNSPRYQQLSDIIVEKLAAHYGSHPAIIGWQLDNELNCELDVFYSESDAAAFRAFLQQKYGTLERLNHAWGTVFWNQEYTGWEQIGLPGVTPQPEGEGNPHQKLDYLRFISHSACGFAKRQADILRRHLAPGVFITTNGMFAHLDYQRLRRESLDFLSYDSYPNFAFGLDANPGLPGGLDDRKWSMNLSEVRAVSPNFAVLEQQSGPNGWTFRMEAPSPKPGQLTLWTMQSVAHGADYISYFRWRTCTVGTEIYWHGILDYDSRDNRRLAEVAAVSGLFGKIGRVAGARYKAGFALVKEYDNAWDAEYDHWHGRVEKASRDGWFAAAQLAHAPMDYLYITEHTTPEDLQRYPVLVYPHATILTEGAATLLEAYVAGGGTLVMGCRSGYKNEHGHCLQQPKPGPLAEVFGCDVADFTLLGPADKPFGADWNGESVEAALFHDILHPTTGQVLARYEGEYYQGQPALVKNRYGRGTAYYFGAAFSRAAATRFMRELGLYRPYGHLLCLPPECELAVREKEGVEYLFVLNYAWKPVTLTLHRPLYSLYTGETLQGEITLDRFETLVLQAGE